MRDKQGFVKGERAEKGRIEWTDCKSTEEEFEEVIKPFICTGFDVPKQQIYVSSAAR